MLISPTGAGLILLQIHHDIVILGLLIVFLSAAKVQCTEYIGYIVAAPINGQCSKITQDFQSQIMHLQMMPEEILPDMF